MRACPPASSIWFIGVPAEISEYLIPHPMIRKISFTGSTAGRQAARGPRRRAYEAHHDGTGGHAPAIVFNDADIETAAKLLAAAKFRNAGQVCTAPTRFLVQGMSMSFLDGFIAAARSVEDRRWPAAGDAAGPARQFAPRRGDGCFIADAIGQGAKLRTGGARSATRAISSRRPCSTDVPLTRAR